MTKDEALKLALEALERVSTVDDECDIFAAPLSNAVVEALTAIREALAQPERTGWPAGLLQDDDCKLSKWLASKPGAKHVVDMAQPEQEPVTWRNAAIRVGEDLCSVGPSRYYDMTPEQWLDWALSVVTVYASPKRPWVELTDEERDECDWGQGERDYARIIEAKLKEKNT